MKKIIPLIISLLVLVACGSQTEGSVESIIASNDLKAIRAKKAEIIAEQNRIKDQIQLLDEAIAELDENTKIPLITTYQVDREEFTHYLELQGSVTTKDLLVIYPEYSGILTDVYVTDGDKVRKGQVLARIDDGGLSQQLAQLKIQAELSKTTFERQQRLWDQKIGSEMQYLQAKSNYESQTQAIAQLVLVDFPILNKQMESIIRQVGDFIDPNNRTFKVEITVPDNDSSIKPNLTAKLKINDYTNPEALLIPQSVISENASGEQYIYIVNNKQGDDAVAEKITIETGLTQGDVIEVLAGLESGTEIILEGARSVNDGQKVRIINSES